MKIRTLTSHNYLFLVNRGRDVWLLELEKRKAFRYLIAIFTCIAIIVIAWTIRP